MNTELGIETLRRGLTAYEDEWCNLQDIPKFMKAFERIPELYPLLLNKVPNLVEMYPGRLTYLLWDYRGYKKRLNHYVQWAGGFLNAEAARFTRLYFISGDCIIKTEGFNIKIFGSQSLKIIATKDAITNVDSPGIYIVEYSTPTNPVVYDFSESGMYQHSDLTINQSDNIKFILPTEVPNITLQISNLNKLTSPVPTNLVTDLILLPSEPVDKIIYLDRFSNLKNILVLTYANLKLPYSVTHLTVNCNSESDRQYHIHAQYCTGLHWVWCENSNFMIGTLELF